MESDNIIWYKILLAGTYATELKGGSWINA